MRQGGWKAWKLECWEAKRLGGLEAIRLEGWKLKCRNAGRIGCLEATRLEGLEAGRLGSEDARRRYLES
jgi:hypothetical protein